MQIEESKSNDYGASPNASGKGENDIRSRLRKNPNKTKFLYTDDFSDKKSKKKEMSSPLNMKDVCRGILEILKKDPKSELFRQPAIKSFSDQKDREIYKRRIKEPRDLGYIAKKLKGPNYSAKEFYDDLELCWSNALLFNDNDTEAYHCATYLKELSSKLYKEKGLFDVINKEKEKEKETNSNNNASSNTNTNDSMNTPNKTPSKINKNNNSNKKDNKGNKEQDNSEKTDTISSNSNYSSKSNKSNRKNTDSSFSSELKNNLGRKRKRQKKKEDKNNDKNDDKNKSLEKDKKLTHKRGRKKKIKSTNEESNQESIHAPQSKLSFDDIKNKYPINHQIISNLDDIDKIIQNNKSDSVNESKSGKNLSKNKNNQNNTNHSNHHTSELHNKKKRKNSNTNNNSINLNLLSKEDKKKVFYEIIWEIYNGNNPFNSNTPEEPNKNNQNNNDNNIFLYNPNKYKIENKEMLNYDNNCNKENVYNVVSLNEGKKHTQSETGSKSSKQQNSQNNNDTKNANNNNAVKDKKDDKNMQLRVEIAKYFDNLTDNNMIELLVYIENIRPQSIRLLENDTIYLDMEAFNDETFIKVFEFVKKHV